MFQPFNGGGGLDCQLDLLWYSDSIIQVPLVGLSEFTCWWLILLPIRVWFGHPSSFSPLVRCFCLFRCKWYSLACQLSKKRVLSYINGSNDVDNFSLCCFKTWLYHLREIFHFLKVLIKTLICKSFLSPLSISLISILVGISSPQTVCFVLVMYSLQICRLAGDVE